MNREQIARVAHEVNRTMTQGKGKPPAWDELGEKTKGTYLAAVDACAKLFPAEPVAHAQPAGFLPVRYVGHRETYVDGTYGTHIRFTRGSCSMVPADKAKLMLRHADVYEAGDASQAAAPVVASSIKDESDDPVQMLRDAIGNMSKEACTLQAKVNYQVDLDPALSVEDMRSRVTQLLDQFGL
jgi:hypothetical protein